MFHDSKNLAAFSLFEMLLVLVVSGVIAMSAIKYAQQAKIDRVADVLANKMYFFSQSVRAYVRDNSTIENGTFVCPTVPGSTCVSSNGKYVFTGVTWITSSTDPNTGEPLYLSSDFTFNDLEPLELQNNGLIDDQAVTVTINGADILINYGMLYDMKDPASPQPETAVAGEAAQLATHLYDPQMGPSSFTYVGGLQADGNLLPIQATQSTGGASDAFLRLDGSSAMRGDITFDPNAASNNITGVNQITFAEGGVFKGIVEIEPSLSENDLSDKNRSLNQYFCALGRLYQRKNTDGGCNVYVDNNNWRMSKSNKNLECKAMCFRYN